MNFNPLKKMTDKDSSWMSFAAFMGSVMSLGLAAAVAALFFFVWLTDEVLEGDTRLFDESVRNFVHGFAGPQLTALMNFFTFLGSTSFLIVLGACALIGFLLAGRRRAACIFAVTMLGATVLNFSLKLSFRRPRPLPYFDTPLPDSFSFPSGHALFSFCFYVMTAWLVTVRLEKPLPRIVVWSCALLLVIMIGLSRIYLGVHYPSDVVAGYAAALVWLLTVILVHSRLRKRNPSPDA